MPSGQVFLTRHGFAEVPHCYQTYHESHASSTKPSGLHMQSGFYGTNGAMQAIQSEHGSGRSLLLTAVLDIHQILWHVCTLSGFYSLRPFFCNTTQFKLQTYHDENSARMITGAAERGGGHSLAREICHRTMRMLIMPH